MFFSAAMIAVSAKHCIVIALVYSSSMHCVLVTLTYITHFNDLDKSVHQQFTFAAAVMAVSVKACIVRNCA